MALGCSVRERTFTAVWLAAISNAENNASRVAPETAATPGRRMIIAPANPTAMAVQRRALMRSPSTSTAATEANSGMVKLKAVASARGRWRSA